MENWRKIWRVSCLVINLGLSASLSAKEWSGEGYHHYFYNTLCLDFENNQLNS